MQVTAAPPTASIILVPSSRSIYTPSALTAIGGVQGVRWRIAVGGAATVAGSAGAAISEDFGGLFTSSDVLAASAVVGKIATGAIENMYSAVKVVGFKIGD